MKYRIADQNEYPSLAELNHQLIKDEGHRSKLSIDGLAKRMRELEAEGYKAVIFEEDGEIIAYGMYIEHEDKIYLRQFFVQRNKRRMGYGKKAMSIFMNEIWPKDKRLTVEVLVNNKSAYEFWKSIGYIEYSIELEIIRDKEA